MDATSGKHVTSVYLSARFGRKAELTGYIEELREHGINVTSRWLTTPTPTLNDEAWRWLAVTDKEDVHGADALVIFAEKEQGGGGGRHVEFGMALALDKLVIVVGEIENLFQRLPEVRVVGDWPSALALLSAGR